MLQGLQHADDAQKDDHATKSGSQFEGLSLERESPHQGSRLRVVGLGHRVSDDWFRNQRSQTQWSWEPKTEEKGAINIYDEMGFLLWTSHRG